uniref:RNase H domain-containing protein n=1 Tax=Syphacia muris TaxID=451379 RepID=A0A0N5AXX7_9BILA
MKETTIRTEDKYPEVDTCRGAKESVQHSKRIIYSSVIVTLRLGFSSRNHENNAISRTLIQWSSSQLSKTINHVNNAISGILIQWPPFYDTAMKLEVGNEIQLCCENGIMVSFETCSMQSAAVISYNLATIVADSMVPDLMLLLLRLLLRLVVLERPSVIIITFAPSETAL